MTSKIRLPLMLLTVFLPGHPEMANAFDNGRDLAAACRAVEKGVPRNQQDIRIPNTKEALLCWGYMQAAQDMVVLADGRGSRIMGACPPDTTTTLDLVRAFLAYGRSRPDTLNGNAILAVIAALQSEYPCSQVDSARLPDAAG
jgi:hypothetical protein